jgi:hypothetical protein
MGRKHSDRIAEALKEYNQQHPNDPIAQPEQEPTDDRNFFVKAWDRLGKTGQVIALVAGILTGLTTIKPYIQNAWNFMGNFVYAVDNVEQNSHRIQELEKYNEVTSSILKSVLFPYYHKNPDGVEIKLYKTRDVNGKHMTYHFVDCCIFYAANYNIESGKWYYIDDTGGYHEINK